jgi:alpha-tubulin suppressor-like RCC1 family protein
LVFCFVRRGLAALVGSGLVLLGLSLTGAGVAVAASAPGVPWAWGSNSYGQLGNGTTSTSPSGPAPVAGLDDVVDLSGGREHVVALTASGAVYTWGSDQEGQLGDGGTANRTRPARITVPCASGGVTSVEAGHNTTLALCGDGTVWSWGLNSNGQLGDGTRTTRRVPVQVRSVTDAVAIGAGRDMSYAVRADGTALAWGDNAYGELGDGTTTDRLTPVPVRSLTDVVGVAGGRDHGLALLGDGSVWSFGWNAYGQLGDGTTTNRATPVRVTDSSGHALTGVTQVAAGAHHSYALLTDGTVRSWGRNYRAELGDGTTTSRTRAVPVLGVAGAVSLGSGRDSGAAVLSDGTVRAWGHNLYGQLGDGTTTNRTRAVEVPGVAGATMAGGGGSEYLTVLVGSGPPQPQPPVARFTSSCDQLSCTFEGSGSSDPDGTVEGYDWSIEGSSPTGPTVSHTFGAAGTYPVTLTVTDDSGLTGTTTAQVTVADTPPAGVAFRAVKTYDANVTRPGVTVASATGDQVVVLMTTNRLATAATPVGWTLLGTVTDGSDLRSWAFTRTAAAGSTSFSVTLDSISKTNLTALSYSGAGTPAAVGANEAGTTTQHTSPPVTVASSGSTVVGYWADKPPATHGWTLPAEVTSRSATAGSGGGLLTSTSGDSAGVPAGTWPGATATAGVASAKAVAWTVVLPPA